MHISILPALMAHEESLLSTAVPRTTEELDSILPAPMDPDEPLLSTAVPRTTEELEAWVASLEPESDWHNDYHSVNGKGALDGACTMDDVIQKASELVASLEGLRRGGWVLVDSVRNDTAVFKPPE